MLDRNRTLNFWFLAPVKHLGQSLKEVKYEITVGDLADLHRAIVFYEDLESINSPDIPGKYS